MEPVKIISKDQLLSIYPDEDLTKEILTTLENHADNPVACWKTLTRDVLRPDMPPELHHQLFKAVFNQDEKYSDAPAAWFTEPALQKNTNLNKLFKKWGLSNYDELHQFSVTQKESFWKGMLEELDLPFDKSPEQVLDLSDGIRKPGWLRGAHYNIAEACFRAPENKTAIVFGKENGEKGKLSYKELQALSSRVANGLKDLQFGKGDRAAIDMPMTAESVAIYLGVVMAGGAVVSIADSLAPAEVDKRLRIANTKLLFTQDVLLRGSKSLPLYEKLLEINPVKTIVLPAKENVSIPLRDGDVAWSTFLSDLETFAPISCNAHDYCNILFSSGTTGDPKAIPWTHTTPIKAATDGFAHQDIQLDDVVCWPTNIGWMMGPWLIFSSLMNKATMALFYGAPTGREFGKFVEEAKVSVLGVVPSMVKRWKQTGSLQGIDWTNIKLFSSTGESSNPQDYLWLMAQGGYKPVIEYC
ncbi:MAG TPA: AMP-binding protein, partial [Bacteroidales bacterium]|nr:AMP-binding protein [Bacteroidales bacterium]